MSIKDDKVLSALITHVVQGHNLGYRTGESRQEALYAYVDKLIEDAKKEQKK